MDWIRFLDENNVHYVTRGPNTRRGEVSVKCPLCLGSDESEHLGINLETEKWGCWRDQSHRGKSARTLIKALLGCSSTQAGLIVKQYSHSDPDGLEAALNVLQADTNSTIQHEEDLVKLTTQQKLGPQFHSFNQIKVRGLTRRFYDYLGDRGYDNPHEIIQHYDLRCALTGRYKDRIIIPIRLNGELLGWTSRAIGVVKNAPRYLASNEDVKTTVFNFDELKEGGNRLFIVEGPFDAIKVDSFGRHMGVRATCTFGTSVSISQIALLRALIPKFDSAWILFDKGAEGPAHNLAQWTNCKVAGLPRNIKDPGDLPKKQLDWMCTDRYDGDEPFGLASLVATTLRNRTAALVTGLNQNNALLKRLSNKP